MPYQNGYNEGKVSVIISCKNVQISIFVGSQTDIFFMIRDIGLIVLTRKATQYLK